MDNFTDDKEEDGINPQIIEEIYRKMEFTPNNITLGEWAATYKDRFADMSKFNKSPEASKFLEKWSLYGKKQEFVRKKIFYHILVFL